MTDLLSLMESPKPLRFTGPFDDARLTGQLRRIVELMIDGSWRTLAEIEELTGDPQASVSAQLRHCRKPRFGANTVERRRRGVPTDGLWEYRLILNQGPTAS